MSKPFRLKITSKPNVYRVVRNPQFKTTPSDIVGLVAENVHRKRGYVPDVSIRIGKRSGQYYVHIN